MKNFKWLIYWVCFLTFNLLFTNLISGQTNDSTDNAGNIPVNGVKAGTAGFNKGAIVSPYDLIIGRVPALSISSRDGCPGGNYDLLMRGVTTLMDNGSPLIVLDGTIVSYGQFNIHPNDIDSFTILRDAEAIAIYGENGANGAVVISTKKGKNGLNVNYSGKVGFSVLPKKYDVYSADEYRQLIKDRYAGNQKVIDLLGDATTDWQKEIFRAAFVQDHHLAVSTQVKGIPLRASFGETDMDGILKTSGYNRTSASLSVDPVLLNNHLKIDVNLNGFFNNNRIASKSAIRNAVRFDPTQPVFDDNAYGGYFAWESQDGVIQQAPSNPLALLEQTNNRAGITGIIGNIKADYRLHFFPDLRVVLDFGEEYLNSEEKIITDSVAEWNDLNIREQKKSSTQKFRTWDLSLNYSKVFNSFPGKMDVVAGFSRLENSVTTKSESSNFSGNNANFKQKDGFVDLQVAGYFKLGFSLKSRYSFNLSLRNDYNSSFAAENRDRLGFAGIINWNIKNEAFLKNFPAISDLNLRLSYAKTGRNPWLYRSFAGEMDAEIKHELIGSFDAGIDFGFLDGRISGSLDYYSRTGEKLFMKVPVPSGTNLSSYIIINFGKISNKGIEAIINARMFSSKNWLWEIGCNASYNRNRIVSFESENGVIPQDDLKFLSGVILGGVGNTIQVQHVGDPAGSFFVYRQVYGNDGKPLEGVYVDNDQNGQINVDDRKPFGKYRPDVVIGLNSTLKYKNWNFSFSGRTNLGNWVYNNVNSSDFYSSLYSDAGYLSNITKSVYGSGFETAQYFSDYYVENASFFRMDYMDLGYCFNTIRNNKLNLRVSFVVQNVFTLTDYSGLDPEVSEGIEKYSYPRSRTFLLALELGL